MIRRTTHPGATATLIVVTLLFAGTSLRTSAADAGSASSFVPIAPCRLLDTRAGADNVGSRISALGPDETYTVDVWGTHGNCTVPAGATGVSMNVVAVAPTAASYLTVFPGGRARPLAASLNWVAGQPPTPNGVTAALSTMGALNFYNLAGTVQLAVDIVGYYLPASGGSAGPAGPPGPPGPPVANVIWVATSGGQYTSVGQALASITDNGPNHRYLVMVGPGTFVETSTIELKDYVDIQGSGQNVTTLTCSCSDTATNSTIVATGPVHTELRNLTVTNSGIGVRSIGVTLSSVTAAMSIVDTTITATSTGGWLPRFGGVGLDLVGSDQPHLDALDIYVNGSLGRGIQISYTGGVVVVRNSWIYVTDGWSVLSYGSMVRLVASTVNGAIVVTGTCDLVIDVAGEPVMC